MMRNQSVFPQVAVFFLFLITAVLLSFSVDSELAKAATDDTKKTDAASTDSAASTKAPTEVEPISEEFLTDAANIEIGKGVWQKRCKFCHGNSAYPGKAPKLRPDRYEPAFVYKRVTNGFRGMPPFAAEFSDDERKSVVAYILSPVFSQK